jgi:MFS family permease
MLIFPVSLTAMIFAPLGGRFSDRVGARIPATVGLILISLTIFSFTLLKEGISPYHIIWRQVVFGIGIALFNPANNSTIMNSLSRDKVGLASGLLALSRNFGMAIGVAFAEMVIALRASAIPLERGSEGPSLESIQDVWKIVLILGLTAVLLSWTGKRRSEI